MATDLILGTAGHIDHGKTSLIRALTGVDTDRLPEEKRRGITIDLGFAQLKVGDYRLGIVDVPGHERFVRNMLAGATGMDLAMLVIAADDSIKPQTREHLEILRLLNLRFGIVALTKCDLVEPDWIALVQEEVREFVADTFLANAPIVCTSATTGQGLDQLRDELIAAASQAAGTDRMHQIDAPFRMAIDRAFTIAGHGTVVTGSIASGRVKVGDELVVEPGPMAVRVRGLQNHDRQAQDAHRGQRCAINLAGIHHDQIRRGQELATSGHLCPSRLFIARVSMLASIPRALKNRARVRVHVGTAELLAVVRLLDRDRLEPGDSAPAQLFLNESAVSVWRQPFVIRSESPVVTIGGGTVLVPDAEKIRDYSQTVANYLQDLSSHEQATRASAALYFAGLRGWQPVDLARTAGIDDTKQAYQVLKDSKDLEEISLSPTRTIRLHRAVLEQLGSRVEAFLLTLHKKNPLRSTLDRAQLTNAFAYLGDQALIEAILKQMGDTGRIKLTEKDVSLVGQGPKLSNNEEKLLEHIIQQYLEAGLKPPTIKECQQMVSKNRDSVPQLVALAAANGDLVKIANDFYLHAHVENQVREQLTREFADHNQGLTLSEIRERLKTTRKYAVPLCEYFDAIGFTKRQGDLRVLT